MINLIDRGAAQTVRKRRNNSSNQSDTHKGNASSVQEFAILLPALQVLTSVASHRNISIVRVRRPCCCQISCRRFFFTRRLNTNRQAITVTHLHQMVATSDKSTPTQSADFACVIHRCCCPLATCPWCNHFRFCAAPICIPRRTSLTSSVPQA